MAKSGNSGLKGTKDNSHRKGWPAQEKARRRQEAQERQAAYEALSPEEKEQRLLARGITREIKAREWTKIDAEIAARDHPVTLVPITPADLDENGDFNGPKPKKGNPKGKAKKA